MKILVIPDIHGRTFWKTPCQQIDKYDKIVFLGDYVDPYKHEHISEKDAIENFKQILDFAEQNKDKVVLLLGNHDLHYTSMTFNFICGGCRKSLLHSIKISSLFNAHQDLFNIAFETESTLFTHAGYMFEWGKKYGVLPKAAQLNMLNTAKNIKVLTDVSYARGGNNLVGSCVWSDVTEKVSIDKDTHELINITGCNKYQIFGHTLQVKLSENGQSYEFDNIKDLYKNKFWAMLDNGHAWEYDEENMSLAQLENSI